jgi:predicted amidohydrolase YtcJ
MPNPRRQALLLRDARISGTAEPVDLRLSDGVIAEIEPAGILAAFVEDREVRLDGRFVIPGLWDHHVHFTQWALVSQRLDLRSASTAAGAAAIVGRHVAIRDAAVRSTGGSGEDQLIVGYGFRGALWADSPSREILDAASGSHPVALVSGDLHSCWLNSAALIERGMGDHSTGLLSEDDCYRVISGLDAVDAGTLDASVRDAAETAARRGVVGIVDLEMAWNLEPWLRRIQAGHTSLRVAFGIYPDDLDRAIEAGFRTGDVIPGTGGLLTVGPFKVLTDGSLNTRTAYCFDEYSGAERNESSRGFLAVPADDLITLLRSATVAGITPAVHAIGDHANTMTLDAFEAIGAGGFIEHAQLLDRSDIPRFAELGVVASVQPEHAMDDRDVADRLWAGRTDRAFAIGSLLRAGATLVLGSDAPVAPLDPWVTIAAAVGRTRDGREAWHPEEAISREQAIAASALGRDRLAAGQVADLAVLDSDPFACTVEELRDMGVVGTILGGQFSYDGF